VGILAYDGTKPVGWCSIAPRETYRALARSRTLARIDAAPVWAVTCFFVNGKYRRRGVATALLRAAVGFAGSKGGNIVEGYPIDQTGSSYRFMGSPEMFEAVGFVEVTPAGRIRKVMRYIDGTTGA
jgi:GNAT superfamily N-acetyltransferase